MVVKFRDERDWRQFHNPKDLALSLSLEASELLELFQWKTSEEALEHHLESMKDELADILIYALLFSEETGIDVYKAVKEKLQKNNYNYPVEKAYGNKTKYTEFK
ncbi:nucleotide pyrophosphohydrolase [Bacillus aquiflavi]|uniref:Nucleotide pyrophosphohydrolase n=1 Tax=Bacillus aquiflavi TaxID=2672567 RepID=A0A6B3VYL7_9BACI|nr:nucleotide pyrophosphohydrolase [Bacillus aquiflavi]MBA4537058.1 nucleotide pyrophosphohydrolase [Bacillus aquiflavi]NEY81355.1 nucleotide pyrophosphohydrolase [Bacillus aquiflavi]UAC48319.1 nucleotide pyrophosphohydrolase [Bacillus aquiflavi]